MIGLSGQGDVSREGAGSAAPVGNRVIGIGPAPKHFSIPDPTCTLAAPALRRPTKEYECPNR